jgi:electron transport complex protein RnfG
MMKGNHLKEAWLVLLLAGLFGGGLSGIEIALKPRIEANRLAETVSQIPALVPGAVSGEREVVGGRPVFRAVDADQQTVGWVVTTGGQGFADRIELLVAMDTAAEKLTGVYVLDQKETPGLGNRIVEVEWRAQFAAKSTTTPLVVTKSAPTRPEQIHGVTGATISSESVVDIVNQTMQTFRAVLRADDTAHGSSL